MQASKSLYVSFRNFINNKEKLVLDFLREQVVIWKYVYTCAIREKDQRLCEDDPEMGPAWDFAC